MLPCVHREPAKEMPVGFLDDQHAGAVHLARFSQQGLQADPIAVRAVDQPPVVPLVMRRQILRNEPDLLHVEEMGVVVELDEQPGLIEPQVIVLDLARIHPALR